MAMREHAPHRAVVTGRAVGLRDGWHSGMICGAVPMSAAMPRSERVAVHPRLRVAQFNAIVAGSARLRVKAAQRTGPLAGGPVLLRGSRGLPGHLSRSPAA